MKLTKKWKRIPETRSSLATFNDIELACSHIPGNDVSYPRCLHTSDRWVGKVSFDTPRMIYRHGPFRASIKLAKQDAEKLAMELFLDVRDGARMIMERFGGEEYDE